jgi:hypothetical protein
MREEPIRKRDPDLAEDLNLLIEDMCRKWGFCNRLWAEQILTNDEALTADAFAVAVLMAEGMDTRPGAPWYLELRRLFKRRYGVSVSKATYAP